MQCLKNGLALWAATSSGVDKYKRIFSRSSGSSRTLDDALLGRPSLLVPVKGGGGGAGSLALEEIIFSNYFSKHRKIIWLM